MALYQKELCHGNDETLSNTATPEKKILPIFAGGNFDFGRYPYESTGEIKPIRWKVWALSPQNKIAILISEKIIDAKPFHNEFTAVNWKQSSLCNWLNSDFLNNAFSPSEQLVLVAPYGDTMKNIRVAIPDITDVKNIFPTEDDRKCIVTPYATQRGAWTGADTGCGAWWVNETGNGYAIAVNPLGVCNETQGIAVDYDDIGVRPMIVLSYDPPNDEVDELYGTSGYVKIPTAPVAKELEPQQHPIISYLEEKGLKCSQKGKKFVIAAEGANLTNIQLVLRCEENFWGGCTYTATFTTNIDIDFNKKDQLISDITEKCCDICDISIAANSCELTLTTSLMAVDNKNPGAYCYNSLLKGFIEKIDESSVIWTAYEEEKATAKRRYEEYLAAHAGEVELLQARKQELEGQIAEITAQNERIRHDALNVPAAQEYAEKQKECSMVEQELKGLWFFAFKRKKELQQKLEKLYQEKSMLYNKEEEQRKAVLSTQDTSSPIKKKEIREIEKALKGIQQQAALDSGYIPTP